jgi:3-hydroxyisobutyrate dehydrogenase-like beta-hydroxyacid dehydrogenase
MMVGGEADVLDRARLVLEAFTNQVHHMGPNGTGTLMNAVQI